MTKYEKLLIEAEKLGVKVIEMDWGKDEIGYYIDNKAALNGNLTDKQKYILLAEEIGHHCTTFGDITNQNKLENRKQEKIARNWAYEKLIDIIDIINAFNHGCRDLYEMAEYLDVTEKFLDATIQHYREKKGPVYQIDQYTVYFEPFFGVLKMFQ